MRRPRSLRRPSGSGLALGTLAREFADQAVEHRSARDGDDVLVVLLPEYVPRHWWERFLYNENGRRIREALLGRPNILVAEVPFRREV
jgi:hypothetical protein